MRLAPSGGLMLYFGMPAAFVDTTDIWMEDRRALLAVTCACPRIGFVISGACAILDWLWPGLAAAPLLLQTGVIAAINSALSLKSLLRLDGYHLLSDTLEIPKLRARWRSSGTAWWASCSSASASTATKSSVWSLARCQRRGPSASSTSA